MTEDEKLKIAGDIAALMAAHSFSIYAVACALGEQGLVQQDRIIAWAETFAESFEQSPNGACNKDAAAHLRNFANNFRTLTTIPERAGRA